MKRSMLSLFAVLFLLTGLPGFPRSGRADPAVAYPFQADGYITSDFLISRAEERQINPDLAYNDTDDEWLVVWQDDRYGSWDIWAQRVDADGRVQGKVLTVAASEDDLEHPAVAYDSTQNRYLVVYQNTTNPGIHCQLYEADGEASGGSTIVSGSKARTHPDVAYNPVSNDYLVVWEREFAPGNHDIWGRRVGAGGAGIGVQNPISTLAGDERAPALLAYPVTSASVGRYLLVWSNSNSGTYNITGRRLNADGSLLGSGFGISTGTDEGSGDEHRPKVALDTTSDLAFVVWEHEPPSGEQDIVGRLVDISEMGANVLGEWLIIEEAAGDPQFPDVAYNAGEDEYVVVWQDSANIHGSLVAADASAAGEPIAICEVQGVQSDPAVAVGADRALVAWDDGRSEGEDIMGQWLSQSGELLGDEIGLSVAASDQDTPALAYGTAQQEWLVVWEDRRDGAVMQIWGQFVGRDGRLVAPPRLIAAYPGSAGPDVAYNPARDEFLVVWHVNLGSGYDILSQRVSAADRSLEGSIVQITTDPDLQDTPVVAYNDVDDVYLVAWHDLRDAPVENPSEGNIYGRRLNSDGTPADGDDFAICARESNQQNPALAFNPEDGLWLVTWNDFLAPGILGQRVGVGDPPLVGPDITVHEIEDGPLWTHALACNTDRGVWLSVWGSNEGLYARRINGEGSLIGSGDIVVSDATGGQYNPDVAFDASTDRYFVVWEDTRFGQDGDSGPDIVGQALARDGTLLFTESDTNAPVWVYPGEQRKPAVAFDPADGRGLVVWGDRRSDEYSDVYGRLGDPEPLARVSVFLPVMLKEH